MSEYFSVITQIVLLFVALLVAVGKIIWTASKLNRSVDDHEKEIKTMRTEQKEDRKSLYRGQRELQQKITSVNDKVIEMAGSMNTLEATMKGGFERLDTVIEYMEDTLIEKTNPGIKPDGKA